MAEELAVAEDAMWIDFQTLERFTTDVFMGLGIPGEDARVCAEVIIEADRRGIYSHGVNRLKQVYYDRIGSGILEPVTSMEVVREGPTTAVMDGHNGMGMVIAKRSMELAIRKASRFGMGMVAVRNSNHYGIAGYYATMATAGDMVGITGTNARPSVAPTFGVENMLGTNPLTIGIPTDEPFPFVLDCATSVSQRGKIEAYGKMRKKLPSCWAIGEDGRPKTDPQTVLKELDLGTCALTPLGGIGEEGAGYKGYGYSTAVEIFSAAFSGANFLKGLLGMEQGKKAPHRLGHFFIAIDISAFTDPRAFKKTAGEILRQLRASKKMPGQERIYTAGEKEHFYRLEMKDRGVPLNKTLQGEIRQMRDKLGLAGYDFGF